MATPEPITHFFRVFPCTLLVIQTREAGPQNARKHKNGFETQAAKAGLALLSLRRISAPFAAVREALFAHPS